MDCAREKAGPEVAAGMQTDREGGLVEVAVYLGGEGVGAHELEVNRGPSCERKGIVAIVGLALDDPDWKPKPLTEDPAEVPLAAAPVDDALRGEPDGRCELGEGLDLVELSGGDLPSGDTVHKNTST
jgi:hypothetical protein